MATGTYFYCKCMTDDWLFKRQFLGHECAPDNDFLMNHAIGYLKPWRTFLYATPQYNISFFPAFKWIEFRNRILISPDRKMTTHDEHIGHNNGCSHKPYNTDTVDGPAKSCTTKRMVETCWNPIDTWMFTINWCGPMKRKNCGDWIWIFVQPMRASSVSSLVRYQCHSLYYGWASEIRITSW